MHASDAESPGLGPLIVRVEDTDTQKSVEYAFIRSPVRLGRSAHNDLRLPHRFVSAWHGVIEFDDDGVRYTDLGSTNGTLLNGAPVLARATIALDAEAEIGIGPLRFTAAVREHGRPDDDAGPGAPPAAGTAATGEHGSEGEVPASAAADVAVAPGVPAAPPPIVAPGGITAMMRQLVATPTGSAELAWRHVLIPGARIGRFELIREIGRGSFGVVFEAKDRQLGRLVAFKAVRPGRESQILFRQEILEKEAEAAAQLNHPNIVSLYDVGTCESGPYLILELLRGESLRERLRRGRPSLVEALEIAIEIAWALDHAHSAGVIHRDLKPANVFLCASGHAKVLDFGIAHVFGAGSRKAVGTPAYMAPEQWRQEPQDARADVFGAAVMLAEMVTGRIPYRVTKDWSEVLDPGARPALSTPGLPPQLTSLLRSALSPDPADRPADGHAWLAALLRVHEAVERPQSLEPPRHAGAATPARAEESRPAQGEDRGARRAWFMAALVAALILAIAVAGYLVAG